MFIDPKDKRKVIIQSEDKKIPILKEDISIVYVDKGGLDMPFFGYSFSHKPIIYINNFLWIPENCFYNIRIKNELALCSILEKKCSEIWNHMYDRGKEYDEINKKYLDLRKKLLADDRSCSSNMSEKDLRYYLKNREWYDNYNNNMPAIETKSTLKQIMKMIGKYDFIKIPIEWSFKGKDDFREFRWNYNKRIIEGYYRPKTPVIKPSDKKTHVHIHVHNKNYTSKNINIDINQLIDKIISGLMDRIFAFGNIKGKTTDAAGKVSPDIEEAEIINATEEICRSLVPVHQQKDIRSVIVRRVNEIIRRN